METLPDLGVLGPYSGWAIVGYGVLMIIRGALVPRRTYEDILHDRDEWRAAQRISESARIETDLHRHVGVEAAQTFAALMGELQDRLGPFPPRDEVER
jgi:hypothetical protein